MNAAANKPVVELVATAALDAPARAELFEFCDRFSSRHRDRFEAQLAKDEMVFRVRARITGHLVGFGTLTVHEVQHQGETATVIYTGWTMISHEFRRHGIIQRVGFTEFLRQRLRHPRRRIYWMMTSSTLNSYLVMARNFRDSYPRAGRPLSPRERAFVEQVLQRNGSVWNPDTGVIERGGASFYREGRVDQGAVDTRDPHIAFYVEANPGQAEGDSLVCLAPLTLRNFWFIARRQLARGKPAGPPR
ncbi:MAG: hypothetical protein U1F56_17420 [Rubrivivax sp.]